MVDRRECCGSGAVVQGPLWRNQTQLWPPLLLGSISNLPADPALDLEKRHELASGRRKVAGKISDRIPHLICYLQSDGTATGATRLGLPERSEDSNKCPQHYARDAAPEQHPTARIPGMTATAPVVFN